MNEIVNREVRGPGGRFGIGNGGRKPGSKNRVSKLTLSAIQELSGEAVAQLKIKLRAGEFQAIRLVLEATLPKGGRTVDLDSTDPHAIAEAALMGEISPDEAARLAQAVKTAADAGEVREMKQQIADLERLVLEVVRK